MFIQEARNHFGGIWVVSNGDNHTFSLIDLTAQAITFEVRKRNVAWFYSAIYASVVYPTHTTLWDYFTHLNSTIKGPWVILGDLNEVISPSKVQGVTFSISRASLLINALDTCNIDGLDLVGGRGVLPGEEAFRVGLIRKKLDRFMANLEWRILFSHALVELLPPINSDHNPI